MQLMIIKCVLVFTYFFQTFSLQSTIDPFQVLGIPEFKLQNIESFDKSNLFLPKLETVEDLPKFMQSGAVKTGIGMRMLTKFLTEDDDTLKENGGVYDDTGFDGLDPSEDIYPKRTELRNRQRARSAANLYIKNYVPNTNFESYGCTPDRERIPDWLVYIVLLMTSKGQHKLMKVCISENEKKIAFVIRPDEKCAERVKAVNQFEKNSMRYLQKFGFLKSPDFRKEYYNSVSSPPRIHTPPNILQQRNIYLGKQQIINKNDENININKYKKMQKEIIELQKKLKMIEKKDNNDTDINNGTVTNFTNSTNIEDTNAINNESNQNTNNKSNLEQEVEMQQNFTNQIFLNLKNNNNNFTNTINEKNKNLGISEKEEKEFEEKECEKKLKENNSEEINDKVIQTDSDKINTKNTNTEDAENFLALEIADLVKGKISD